MSKEITTPSAPATGSERERWMVCEYEDGPPELWLVEDVMRCIKKPGDSGWVRKLNPPYRMEEIVGFDRIAPNREGAIRIRVAALREAVKALEDRIRAVEALSPNTEPSGGPKTQ